MRIYRESPTLLAKAKEVFGALVLQAWRVDWEGISDRQEIIKRVTSDWGCGDEQPGKLLCREDYGDIALLFDGMTHPVVVSGSFSMVCTNIKNRQEFTELEPPFKKHQRYGCLEVWFDDNERPIRLSYAGNMGASVTRNVDPCLEALKLPCTAALMNQAKSYKEAGSPDYAWNLKLYY